MAPKTMKTPNWSPVQIIVDKGRTYERYICSQCTINCEKIIPMEEELTKCINEKKNQEDSNETD